MLSGSPKEGTTITSGHITHALSGAQNWAELLRPPNVLGGPQNKGPNQKAFITPPFSGGGGADCYVTPAFSGVPKKGAGESEGATSPALSGVQKGAELVRNPCVLRGPQKRQQNQKGLHHPFSGSP